MGRLSCCEKTGLKKGPWTTEEDQKLIDNIKEYGPSNWRALPKKAGLERCGKSCRLRWTNYLRPDIKRGKFSVEEEESIIQLHGVMGNKWSAIAAKLPGRTDNEIKNYWNTHLRKKLLQMGIDPVTHGPRLDLLDLQSILNTLQNPSLLNIPALLNLQTLLNSNLLSSVPSQNGSENRLSRNLLDSSFNVNTSSQTQANTGAHFIQNFPSLDETSTQTNLPENPSIICNVKSEQNAFEQKNHLVSEPCFKWYDNSAFMSNNSNNNSSLSSVFSTSSYGPDNPIDDDLMYLKSSPSIEDELEIDSFFSKILEKL